MASAGGFRFTPNVVVGLTMTIAGAVLLLDTLEVLNARDVVRFWPVLLVLFGVSVIVQALQRGSDGVPPGGGQRPIVTPGLVIMFVVIGLLVSNAYQRRGDGGSNGNGQTVFAVMGRSTRTSTASPFRGADVTTLMGKSSLDLRQATLGPGEEAVIDVFGMMGEVSVIVPDGWDVEVEAVPLMGRVRDRRFLSTRDRGAPRLAPQEGADGAPPDGGETPPPEETEPPRVILRGFIMMGALNIES